MGDDNRVIVSSGDASHSLLPIAGRKVVLTGYKEPSVRVQLQELCSPLIHQMIRHDEHRLFREIQTAEFHRRGSHGPGLASSYDMRQQWAAALKDSPYSILLMWRQISIAKGSANHSRQG